MFLTQIYFPEGIQPGWKFTEIPGGGGGGELWQAPPTEYDGNSRGVGGYDKHPLQCTMEIPGGWGV